MSSTIVMKPLFFLIYLWICLSPLSAQPQTPQMPGLSDTIFCFKPLSGYYLIDDNKQVRPDSVMNLKNQDCLMNGFSAYFAKSTNLKSVDIDLTNDSCYVKELNALIKYLHKQTSGNVPPMACLDRVLDSIHAGYVLIPLSSGFTRSKGNYQKSMVKGVFLSALTLGTLVTVPYESTIELKVILFNAKTRQLIADNECKMVDCDPDSQKDIDTQIKRVFKSAFKYKRVIDTNF